MADSGTYVSADPKPVGRTKHDGPVHVAVTVRVYGVPMFRGRCGVHLPYRYVSFPPGAPPPTCRKCLLAPAGETTRKGRYAENKEKRDA